jgi:spore photoproduct lyase
LTRINKFLKGKGLRLGMISYRPELVLVHDRSWQDGATREILERLSGIETRTVQDADPRSYGKNTLILMHYPGSFLKRCQGAGAEVCCNYFTASYAWNCHLGCTYCILQSYLGQGAIQVCTNIEELLAEVKETLRQSPGYTFRIGTGELADSLALDHITCYSRQIVPFFASLPNGILELKTKSAQIGNLERLDHRGRTVVSWSVNSRRICQSEELKAPSLEERLSAAAQCQKWGYKLGFHFDPLVYYEGWEPEYRHAVREIFREVNPETIAWISLGALRFTPHLRELILKRYPESRLPYGEFVPGHHGKLRYFRPIREDMYRKIKSWIHDEAPKVFVYLCMESRIVWERSFGTAPCGAWDLGAQMDNLAGSVWSTEKRSNYAKELPQERR